MIEIKKILFPIDFTEKSSKISPYVLSVSDHYNSMVYVLHVVEDLSKWGGEVYLPHIPLKEYQLEPLKGAEKALERVCEEQLQSCPNLQRLIASGDPAQEILKIIDSEWIDMVIMGTHGRKGLDHVAFGSVAENVVRISPVPVLTVNPYKIK